MHFNPSKPEQTPIFIGSDENNKYFYNANIIGAKQQKIDSLQVAYFQETVPLKIQTIKIQYQQIEKSLTTFLNNFYQTENNELIKDYIKANTRIVPETPIKIPEEYLPLIKEHYFDHINFNNENLIHSSILIDKVMDYVFYLTLSRDIQMQNKLYKSAVSNVLQKIDNQLLRLGFIKALIQSFTKEENIDLVDYLFANYYQKLDLGLQDRAYKETIIKKLHTAVGRMAPDFSWKEKDKTIKLSQLKDRFVIQYR
jgi:hypothetical protein